MTNQLITFDILAKFVSQPPQTIIDQLNLPACQAAIDILKHLKAIDKIIKS